MIKQFQKIKIPWTQTAQNYYEKLGYSLRKGQEIEVDPLELPSGSHRRIQVICDKCGLQDVLKDNARDKFLNANNIKVLRIKSGKKLPQEQDLINTINTLINSDQMNAEIILDDYKIENIN